MDLRQKRDLTPVLSPAPPTRRIAPMPTTRQTCMMTRSKQRLQEDPTDNKTKENIIGGLTKEMEEFTGNKLISWDKSVKNLEDQMLIQKLGNYVFNPKTELPEKIKNNICEVVKNIRDRKGKITQEDPRKILDVDKTITKKPVIRIISIFKNPLMLFYFTGRNRSEEKDPEWKLLKFTHNTIIGLTPTIYTLEEVRKMIGDTEGRLLRHSLICFSSYVGGNLKIRNGLIFSVGNSQCSSSSLITPHAMRSPAPIPRGTTPKKTQTQTPKFIQVPLDISQGFENSKDIEKINITKSPSMTDKTEEIKTSIRSKDDTSNKGSGVWKETSIELAKGIILHIKYKLEISCINNKHAHPEAMKPSEEKDRETTKTNNNGDVNNSRTGETKIKAKQRTRETKKQNNEEQHNNKAEIQKEKKEIKLYETANKTIPPNPLMAVKESYMIKSPPPRNVSTSTLRHFIETCTIRKPENAQYAFLNLPEVIAYSTTSEVYNNNRENRQTKERKAQSLFMKGRYADAYSLIVNETTTTINPEKDEVRALFPMDNRGKKLSKYLRGHKKKENIKIYENHIASVMTSMKKGKACGPTGMSGELLKLIWNSESRIREKITEIVRLFINSPEKIDKNFLYSSLHCIPKPKGGLRPIAVEETFLKLVNKTVSSMILTQTLSKLHRNQFCIKDDDTQIQAVNTVNEYIDAGFDNIIAVDFKNAYGTIYRSHIVKQLKRLGVDSTLIRYIIHLFENQKMIFTDSTNTVNTISTNRGIAQGDPTSSLLFCIGVDTLLKSFENEEMKIVAYADDFVLMSRNKSTLMEQWEVFKTKAKKIGLEVNNMKTQLLFAKREEDDRIISRTSSLEPKYYNGNYEWSYLDIPISRNKELLTAHIKGKLDKYLTEVKKLWVDNTLPIQTKYHLYLTCQMGKLTYYLRGLFMNKDTTPRELRYMDTVEAEIANSFPKTIQDIDPILRTLPYCYGGMNMMTLNDLATITYIWTKLKNNCEIPEYEHLNIPPGTTEYYKVRNAYFMHKLMNEPSLRNRIQEPNHYSYITLSIQKPPITSKQFLKDNEFIMLLDLIFSMDHTDVQWGGFNKCSFHKDRECDLDHILKCQKSSRLHSIRCHNEVCLYLYKQLKTNKNIKNIRLEKYSGFQQDLKDNGECNKRADIVYQVNGVEHSIDVAVISKKKNKNSNLNLIALKYGIKLRTYKNEPNIHPIVLTNNGDIHDESLKYLNELGINISNLRDIQHIIIKHATLKVQDSMLFNVKTWKQRSRNSKRRNKANNNTENHEPDEGDRTSLNHIDTVK